MSPSLVDMKTVMQTSISIAVGLVLALGASGFFACTPPAEDDTSGGSAASEHVDKLSDADRAMMAELSKSLPQRGETLPAIAGMTLDGTSVDNASLKGKTVLLNLWFFH